MKHNNNQRKLQIWAQAIPLIKPFTISRGTRTQAQFVRARLNDYQTNISVVSDCVPYSHYGESIESVMAQIAVVATAIENGEMTRDNCHEYLPKGAARNAVNCLLWYQDLQLGHVSLPIMPSVTTAQTIVIDTPQAMGRDAHNHRHAPLLKIKLAGSGDAERIKSVRAHAPTSTIIVDANESLTRESYHHYLPCFVENIIAMIDEHAARIKPFALKDEKKWK